MPLHYMCSFVTDGRWVLYGTLGGAKVEGGLFGKLLAKRGTLLATTLRSRADDYKADLVARCVSASSCPVLQALRNILS